MTPEQVAAFINAQIALLNAEVAGMQAENAIAIAMNKIPPFDNGSFRTAAAKYEGVLGYNAVLTMCGAGS